MDSGYHAISEDVDPSEDPAHMLLVKAKSQVGDIRETAATRVKDHMNEAERLAQLADGHREAARLWAEIADSGRLPDAVPSENARKY